MNFRNPLFIIVLATLLGPSSGRLHGREGREATGSGGTDRLERARMLLQKIREQRGEAPPHEAPSVGQGSSKPSLSSSRNRYGGRIRIAVYPIDYGQFGVPGEFVTGMTEMLINRLHQNGKYQVLDRSTTVLAAQEQAIGNSRIFQRGTGPSQTANLGAQVIIRGAVTHYTVARRGTGGGFGIGGFVIGGGGSDGELGMSIRIIDAGTGEVLASGVAEEEIDNDGVSVGYGGFSVSHFEKTPLGDAARKVIGRIVDLLDQGVSGWTPSTPTRVGFRGSIVKVVGGRAYINGGQDKSVASGNEFQVMRLEGQLIDPETGLDLGADREAIGRIRVIEVHDRYSIAEVLWGTEIQRGDLVQE